MKKKDAILEAVKSRVYEIEEALDIHPFPKWKHTVKFIKNDSK